MPTLSSSKFHTEAYDFSTANSYVAGTDVAIYTVPSRFSAIVQHLTVSNNDTSNRNYTIKWYHQDDNETHVILNNHAVAGGTMEDVFTKDKPMYLHSGDIIYVSAATVDTLVTLICVEEYYDPNR